MAGLQLCLDTRDPPAEQSHSPHADAELPLSPAEGSRAGASQDASPPASSLQEQAVAQSAAAAPSSLQDSSGHTPQGPGQPAAASAGQRTAQSDSVQPQPASEPAAGGSTSRVAVGLVYDTCMELHCPPAGGQGRAHADSGCNACSAPELHWPQSTASSQDGHVPSGRCCAAAGWPRGVWRFRPLRCRAGAGSPAAPRSLHPAYACKCRPPPRSCCWCTRWSTCSR